MLLGYNTNGLAFHDWPDALALIAETGYRSVAITIDHHCLNPFSSQLDEELSRMRETLERLGLASVIETGARFLLNPRVKHEPTLLSPNAEQRSVRIDFLSRAIGRGDEFGRPALELRRHVSHPVEVVEQHGAGGPGDRLCRLEVRVEVPAHWLS